MKRKIISTKTRWPSFGRTASKSGIFTQDLAEEVAQRLDADWRYIPIVKEILDDGVADHSFGLLLLLVMAKPDVTEAEIREYANGVVAQILPAEQCGLQEICDGTTPHEARDDNTRTPGVWHFSRRWLGSHTQMRTAPIDRRTLPIVSLLRR